MKIDKAIESIREWLEESGMSQAEMARKAGVSPSTITLIFNGQRQPSAELLVDLAQALGHTSSEILGIAGLLPPISSKDVRRKRVEELLNQATDEQIETLERIAKAIVGENKRPKRISRGSHVEA